MFKITHNQLVRSLQAINHVLLLVGLAYVFITGDYHYLITALLFYWITGVLGVNIGLHRLLSHRSFETYPVFEWLLSFIAVINTMGSPIAWAAVHRQHHRFCEKPGDPHSPHLLGNFRAWVGLWDYRALDLRVVKDMRNSALQRFLHKHYLEIIIGYCVLLAMIDPWLIIFGYAIPACLCLHSANAVVVLAHRHGYKTYDLKQDESRNSWIVNLITLGDGWHNNHHANPKSWSNWERWWEWDIPAVLIKFIFMKKI